jgi:autonomous glycyl radical cofactor GrcA
LPIDSTCQFIDCEAGDQSFGTGQVIAGTYTRCKGGKWCFGYGSSSYPAEFSGTAIDCVCGPDSFGAGSYSKVTGEMHGCVCLGSTVTRRLEGAVIEGCTLTQATNNTDNLVLLDSLSAVHNSTLLVVEGGTGVPINAASAKSVSAVGNRYNNVGTAADGLGVNVTNVGTGELRPSTWTTAKAAMIDANITSRHASGAAVAKSPATLDWSGDVSNKPTIPTAADNATAVRSELTTELANMDAKVSEVPGAADNAAAVAAAVWSPITSTSRTLTGASGGTGPTATESDDDVHVTGKKNGSPRLCARVYLDGVDATQAAIASITYSLYLLDDQDADARTPVTGHAAQSVTKTSVIFDTLQTDAAASNYNFRHYVPISVSPAFTIAGRTYLVEYIITPTTGQAVILRFKVRVT